MQIQYTSRFLYNAGIIKGELHVQHGGSREKHETEIKRRVIKRSPVAGMQQRMTGFEEWIKI